MTMPGLLKRKDAALVFSINSQFDVFSPPRKQSRIVGPLSVRRKDRDIRPSLDMLPDECLYEILRRIPSVRERSISACVSKRWLTILSCTRLTEFFWNTKSEENEVDFDGYLSRRVESKKSANVRLAAIAVGTSSRGGLGKLSIRGSNSFPGVSDHGLTAIARGCPFLKHLSMWSILSITDNGLLEIARECHSLEKLELCQLPCISDNSLSVIAEKCPNLCTLTIESCPNIGDRSLQAVAKFCSNLKSITIIDCPNVGDRGIFSLLASSTVVLSNLKLQSLNITDYSVAVIGYYGKAITILSLSDLPNVRQRSFWAMAKAKGLLSLSSLTITSCDGMGDLSLEAVGRDIPSLKHLSLGKNSSVSDIGLVAFFKASSALQSLHLDDCGRITETGILMALSSSHSKLKSVTLSKCNGIKDTFTEIPFLAPCKSLRCLSIRNCLLIGNTTLNVLAKLCPQVHRLDLNGLCKVTDDGLFSFMESCATLSKFTISNCTNLSDELITTLCTVHGKTLKMLNFEGCHKITDTSLVAVAENCPLLSDLDLSKCSITDSGITALSNGVQQNLEVLSLSGCPMISNGSLPALQKLGKTLLGLNLQNCSSISTGSIELLSENIWKCDLLY